MSDKNNYYQPYHNQNDFNAFQQQAMAANPPMGNSQQGNGGNFVFNPFGYANVCFGIY
jgi:hypothetical protein